MYPELTRLDLNVARMDCAPPYFAELTNEISDGLEMRGTIVLVYFIEKIKQ